MRNYCAYFRQFRKPWAIASLLVILALQLVPVPVAAQTAPYPVALSGTAAPSGGNYSGFGSAPGPELNASGQVAFYAITSNSGGGIFAGTPGSSLTTVALQGTAAPAGGNYNTLSIPMLNASGQVAFFAVTSVSIEGIFAGTPGSPLTTVALKGTAAPAGGNYTDLSNPVINASGQVAFQAMTSVSGYGIFAGTPGSPLATAAIAGTSAPSGGNYTLLNAVPVINATGNVAFRATTSVAGAGIFAGIPGSPLATAALAGTAAPAGGNYTDFSSPVINASGQVVFFASTSVSGSGIFAGIPGSPLATAALQGTPAPAGGNYTSLSNFPVINASGQVAFQAATSVSGSGIFVGTPGSPFATAALAGTPAPNCGGATYSSINTSLALNASGQVAFLSTLTGTGVVSGNNLGFFAGAPGSVVLIVRTGEVIDVDPTAGVDNRTVSNISFVSQLGFNDSGELAYLLTFTDGSSGIFTSSIAPEPTGLLALTGLGLLGSSARSLRNKRRQEHP